MKIWHEENVENLKKIGFTTHKPFLQVILPISKKKWKQTKSTKTDKLPSKMSLHRLLQGSNQKYFFAELKGRVWYSKNNYYFGNWSTTEDVRSKENLFILYFLCSFWLKCPISGSLF